MPKLNNYRVTAVIIAYNAIDSISDSIETLKTQSRTIDQIIVIDDCSTDSTYAFVKKSYPDISTHQTPRNSGPGAARNLGKNLAKHPLVLLLDHDVILKQNLLSELLSKHQVNQTYAIFVPRIFYYHDPGTIQDDGIEMHYLGLSLLSRNNGKTSKQAGLKEAELLAYAGKCYLIDLSRCQKKVFYDEKFFYTFEDLDYSIANNRCGNKALLVPSAEALHKTGTTPGLSHTTSKKYPGRRLELLTRNRLLLISKHYDLKLLIKIIPASLLFDLALLFFSIVKDFQVLSFVRGYMSFFLLSKHIKGYRKSMKSYSFTDRVSSQLRTELKIKPETYQGLITSSIFKTLNRFFIIYGSYILNMRDRDFQKRKLGTC